MIPRNFIVLTLAIGFIALGSAYEICEADETGTFHRDYSSCRGYIACSKGKSFPGQCSEEYLFNEETSACDFPYNVKCTLFCPKSGNTAFRLPNSCSKYINCMKGKATYMECPAGFLFDSRTKKCQSMFEADCPHSNKECPDPRVSNSFGSTVKCSAYYKCFNGKPKLMECEHGLHYNAAEGNCDSPATAKCPIVTNKKEHFNDIEIECPAEGTHFFPHPLNCHLYHICHNGGVTKMMCGRGLYYDMSNKRCELARRARCVVDALKNRVPIQQNQPKETAMNVTVPATTSAPNTETVEVEKPGFNIFDF